MPKSRPRTASQAAEAASPYVGGGRLQLLVDVRVCRAPSPALRPGRRERRPPSAQPVPRLLKKHYPNLVEVLQQAETDILADHGFPAEHRARPGPAILWSAPTRRSQALRCGRHPSWQSLLRLTGTLLE